ncbi:tripartite tricarboxylate transporter TctB family protein [Saccharopolyspora sp. CA-218241]|uniref:tripartite tricarboxylate transporter TctB family protein n=1 Tax=Saccharopolyspora sp. CA-218241 TaxID=3240027 RepID=UPI003D95E3DD
MSTRRRSTGPLVLFSGLALLGGAFATTAVPYGVLVDDNRIGPGFLPLVAGSLLAVFSLLLLARELRTPTAPEPDPPGEDRDDAGRSATERRRILRRVFGLLLLTLLAVPYLGMVLSFGLLVLAISTWLERRRLPQALLMSAATATAMHLLFAVLLDIPLPTGVLGF